MNVLLIFPHLKVYDREIFKFGVVPPLGLAYIASVLEKAGHCVRIIDCLSFGRTAPLSFDDNGAAYKIYGPPANYIRGVIQDFKPELVGISSMMTNSEDPVLEIAELVKETDPSIKVILGGMSITGRPEYFLSKDNIDFVAVSEGEYIMRDLVTAMSSCQSFANIDGLGYKLDGKCIVNAKTKFIPSLDEIPFPALHLLPMEEYFYGQTPGAFIKHKKFGWMITSRGCTLNCSFCTTPTAWQAWRGRSPENVIEEMEMLVKRYGVQEIQFIDDNISADRKRFMRLLDLMIERKLKIDWWAANGTLVHTLDEELIEKMAQTGCYAVIFGLESGDKEMQKYIGKTTKIERFKKIVAKCQEVGIWVSANLVIGLPGETRESARNSLEYAKEANLDGLNLIPAIPLPNTRVFDDVKDNLVIDYSKVSFYSDHSQSISNFTKEEIGEMIKKFYYEFLFHSLINNHLRPGNIIKRLRRIHDKEDVLFYLRIAGRFLQVFNLGVNSMRKKSMSLGLWRQKIVGH